MASIKFIKATAITLALSVALSAFVPVTSANAGGRHHDKTGKIIAAGIIGLALGAIIADSHQQRRRRADGIYYNTPAYRPSRPVVRYSEPHYPPTRPIYDDNYNDGYNDRYDDDYYDQGPADRQPMALAPRHRSGGYRKAYQPAPVKKYAEPRVITYKSAMKSGAEPWTPGWYSYCRAKFRTFNNDTGTYRGYDGKNHFCVAK